MIFSFSMQTANQSGNLSGGILSRLLELFNDWFGVAIPMEQVHNLFRKAAHITEFFVLGVFACGCLKTGCNHIRYALIYGVFVAICDETIQFFTGGGRAMRLSDVGIDTFGFLLAMLLIAGIDRIIAKRRKEKVS